MKTSPSIIRAATPQDAPEIWRMFLQLHHENGIFSLDPQKVTSFMDRALHPELIPSWDTGPRAKIGVVGPLGRLEAIVFVLISQFWYSSDFHLEELLVFVDSEYRASNHARSCIEWMKKLALELEIPLLTGIISTNRTAAKIRLYDRILPRVGAFYMFPLEESSELVKPETPMGDPRDIKRRNAA